MRFIKETDELNQKMPLMQAILLMEGRPMPSGMKTMPTISSSGHANCRADMEGKAHATLAAMPAGPADASRQGDG